MVLPTLDYCPACRSDSRAAQEYRQARRVHTRCLAVFGVNHAKTVAVRRRTLALMTAYARRTCCPERSSHPEECR